MDALIMAWGWISIDNLLYRIMIICYFVGRICQLYKWYKNQKIIDHLIIDGDKYISKQILERMQERDK